MKTTKKYQAVSTIFVLIFLLGLTPLLAAAQGPPALAGLSGPERERVEKLIEGAKKEGELVLWGTHIEPLNIKEAGVVFKEYYGLPNFTIKDSYMSTAECVAKGDETIRAKRYVMDVIWTSAYAWSLDLLKRGMVMEYHSPEYKHFSISDKLRVTESGYWVSDFQAFSPMYNVQVLKKKGMDTSRLGDSWYDWVDPKFKGMLTIGDPTQSASQAANVQGLLKVLEKGYYKKLKANNPVMGVKTAVMRDQLISGEFPIAMSITAKDAIMATKRGTEVVLTNPKEGKVLIPINIVIFKYASHPNGSKLFIDFMRSRKGQELLMAPGSIFIPGRPDIKNPYSQFQPPIEKIKAIPMDWKTEGTSEALQAVTDFWRTEITP